MSGLMQAACHARQPLTLEQAYRQAQLAHGAHVARAEQQQAALDRARRATTPRTASVNAVEQDDDNRPLPELLRREIERGTRGRRV